MPRTTKASDTTTASTNGNGYTRLRVRRSGIAAPPGPVGGARPLGYTVAPDEARPVAGAYPLGGAWVLGGARPLGGAWPPGTAWPAADGHAVPPPPVERSDPDTLVVSLGWIPDIPDGRDFTLSSDRVQVALKAIQDGGNGKLLTLGTKKALPSSADLRPGMSPIEDQGPLGSCTANAVIGAVEYLYLKGCGEELDLSRLFLYKATRKLLGWGGDSGAYLRTTLKALATFGAPPESYWPYDLNIFDFEPDAFVYQMAANFKALTYARLDENGSDGDATLERLRQALADGFPVAFGFPVYSSIQVDGEIPYPTANDKLLGGHAVLAVGYDDAKKKLLIRNSWGPNWGDAGYGWMPYQYVTDQLAADCWTLFSETWLQDSRFDE